MTDVPTTAYGRRTRPPSRETRVPTPAGTQTVFIDERPRCSGEHHGRPCQKLLAEFVARPWAIQCSRCRTRNVRNAPPPDPA